MFSALAALSLTASASAQTPPFGPVVLNEIFYHPPDQRPTLQWVEVHNRSAAPVELAGWSFTKGLTFQFPAGSRLAPGGFAVVARDAVAFVQHYGTNVPLAGVFTGQLSGKGEKVELTDAAGAVSDWVKYEDQAPWSLAADGGGVSLERIHAGSRSDIPANWAASRPGSQRPPWGTPGRVNERYRTNLPPIASEVTFEPFPATRPNPVSVRWNDADGVRSAELRYQVGTAKGWGPEQKRPLARKSGDAGAGEYGAVIPGVPEFSVVRFRFQAVDATGAERVWPPVDERIPTFSYPAGKEPARGTIPQLHVWTQGAVEPPGSSLRNQARPKPNAAPPRAGATAILVPAVGGGPPEVRDYIRVAERAGGWKVRMGKAAPLLGMHTWNVAFEGSPRVALAEHLAYELYRRAGVPAPASGHTRLVLDGESLGYHLYFEQVDESFLERQKRDPDGHLYKLLWYGQGLTGQHERKNHPLDRHEDLKQVVQGLASRNGDAQWKFIQEQFNVDEVINYFAVGFCLQNWDGYFNNYFAYHGPGPNGKWEMYPWDQDKTWGDYDGASDRYDWYAMPLTYGMNGDRPPSSAGFGSGPFGGPMWWRAGGWFSGPLLANPGFRPRFLKRVKELCETEFTEARFLPVIDELEKRLEPEVLHRAEVRGANEAPQIRRFKADIEGFRGQVKGRREFLLKTLNRQP